MNKIQIILRQSCAALMLIAALTIPALAASPTFSDVPEGSALQESVSCLVERGIPRIERRVHALCVYST